MKEILNLYLDDFKNGIISQRQFIGFCRNKNELKNEIHILTEFLDQYDSDLLERLYYIINDIHEVVNKCKYCGNKAIWTGRLNEGYKEICNSKECRSKQLIDVHIGSTKISENRDAKFIKKQSEINYVDDNIIKDLIKYDKLVPLIDNPIILEYLDNRFNDSASRLETVQRIQFEVEEKPKCPTCGQPVVWIGKKSKLYTTYCSDLCRAHNEETTKKMKETQLKKWGTDCCYNSEKYKQQYKEKHGVEYIWQREDIKEKRKRGLIDHYGTTKLLQVEEIKNRIITTCKERYGCENPMQNEDVKQKHYKTCKERTRCGTSNAEDKVYNWLVELGYNVERFIRTEKFPFNADFYLPDFDVYIEYQGSQYHYGRAYLGTKEDRDEIKILKRKNEERIKITKEDHSQYQGMINIWAGSDVKKRNYAKEHNINYFEIYKCNSKDELQYQLNLYLMCLLNESPLIFSDEILKSEFNTFKRMNVTNLNNHSIGKFTCIIKHFQGQNFYKHEMEIFANNPIIRREVIQKTSKKLNKLETELTPDDIITGFKKSGIYYGYSHFNPQWTNWFVNKYNIKTIYDPCGGWGHHLLGMLNCDKIIYNDFSKSTVEGVQQIKDYFNIDNLKVHYGDGTEYIPEEVDGWFMCPPYYNLEHYECGDFNSLDEYKIFLNKIIKLWQNSSSRVFGVILREDLIDYIGIKPNEIYDMKIHKTYLNGGKKNLDEKFYIFKK